MPQNQPLDKEKDKVFIFRCSTCHVPITIPLQLLKDVSLLVEDADKDHLPTGLFYKQPDDGYYSDARNQYIVNNKDFINTKPHPDRKRRSGCCGLDGCDGMNIVCRKNHEVGTQRSDCWMARSTALDPAEVFLDDATS